MMMATDGIKIFVVDEKAMDLLLKITDGVEVDLKKEMKNLTQIGTMTITEEEPTEYTSDMLMTKKQFEAIKKKREQVGEEAFQWAYEKLNRPYPFNYKKMGKKQATHLLGNLSHEVMMMNIGKKKTSLRAWEADMIRAQRYI